MSIRPPRCGCPDPNGDNLCLYPESLGQYTQCAASLMEAREIIKALLLASSWSGSKVNKEAESFLEKTR